MELLTENVPAAENDIQMIVVDAISLFRKHPFRLYEGERLKEIARFFLGGRESLVDMMSTRRLMTI